MDHNVGLAQETPKKLKYVLKKLEQDQAPSSADFFLFFPTSPPEGWIRACKSQWKIQKPKKMMM